MQERDGTGSAASALVPVSPAPLVELVLDSLASEHSRRAYGRALGEFFAWYPSNASGEGFTRAVLGRHRSHLSKRNLSAASINLQLAALRKLTTEAAANGGLAPETAAAILRVPGARRSGVRTGNWLTLQQAQRLLAEPDPETIKGLRDRVLLGLLVGCGLRRGELAGLGKITPHDLRRTFAKLAHLGRAPLEQIQISLGHASIQTTERYLGLKQNLHDAPCDRLGLVGWEA